MPFEIKFENVPVGVCTEPARGGETVKIRAIEFVSEEDGENLIDRLEGFGSQILGMLPKNGPAPRFVPSQVEHLLAIVRRDGTATVYVNEIQTVGMARVKREFVAGDAVFLDDIAGVQRLSFKDIAVPKDAGVLFIFSVGWRRAMFYDFLPLNPKDSKDREYDLEAQLGQFYTYLMFQKRFKITEAVWSALFSGQWFPFVTLKDATIRNLVSHAENYWPLDDLVDAIAQEVEASLPRLLGRWKGISAFAEHLPFLEKALERYREKDYISTTAILYPRIEGLMRSHQKQSDPTAQATQKGLSASATKTASTDPADFTPLLPDKFRQYLEGVYFAAFNPNDPKIKVSRNSIGHGVASADECSRKSATISVLLIDQLCYCFTGQSVQLASC